MITYEEDYSAIPPLVKVVKIVYRTDVGDTKGIPLFPACHTEDDIDKGVDLLIDQLNNVRERAKSALRHAP